MRRGYNNKIGFKWGCMKENNIFSSIFMLENLEVSKNYLTHTHTRADVFNVRPCAHNILHNSHLQYMSVKKGIPFWRIFVSNILPFILPRTRRLMVQVATMKPEIQTNENQTVYGIRTEN